MLFWAEQGSLPPLRSEGLNEFFDTTGVGYGTTKSSIVRTTHSMHNLPPVETPLSTTPRQPTPCRSLKKRGIW